MKTFKQSQESPTFTRRALMVGAAQLCLIGGLGTRLGWLQLSQGQKYKVLSDKNRINIKMFAPSRGEILDRYGVPLAVNNENYRVLLVPDQAENPEESLKQLAQVIDITQDELQRIKEDMDGISRFSAVEIRDNLSWDEVAKIEVNIADLPGIQTEKAESRGYPFGKAAAPVIGYVGRVNKKEMEEDPGNVLHKIPGFRIGKSGIERQYNDMLEGTPGNAQVEVNVVGREIRELKKQPGTPGERLTLTLDGELQNAVYNRLSEEKSASAVVMNPHNGEIYAMGSTPTFDPNVMNNGISNALWQELLATEGGPMNNKAIGGIYPPASTFKMITALAGMRAGYVTPKRTVYCPGHFDYGASKQRFHCWKASGHGTVNVVNALAQSCDVFFYQLAVEIGIEKIAEMAREFGFGSDYKLDFPGVRSGLVPDMDWKLQTQNKNWKPGDTINASIGQGDVLATPLQLAVMTARICNGGYAVKPVLTKKHGLEKPVKIDIEKAHFELIQKGMENTVNSGIGTAFGSRILDENMLMAGKTGTAQVRRITKRERALGVQNEDLIWEHRHHALFVGYAPIENPRYVVSVVVEHGVGGARTAAPLARDILLAARKREEALT